MQQIQQSEENEEAIATLKEQNEVYPDNLSGDFNEDDDEILINPAQPTQVSLFKIVCIIIKTIIGAHIVLIPYTASELGWVFFIFFLILIISVHHFTSVLLLKSKNLSRHSNFSTILYTIWHSDASKIFGAALMMVNNLLFCILQFVLIKTTITYMAYEITSNNSETYEQFFNENASWYFYKGYFIIVILCIVQFPFIFTKRIEKLRIFSIVGVIGIIAFILGVVAYFFYCLFTDNCSDNSIRNFPNLQDNGLYSSAASISIIIFALNFHMNFFPIYKGLKQPTDHRMEKASLAGLSSCAVIYIIVGLMGYSLVGDQPTDVKQPNFLKLIQYKYSKSFFYILNISYLLSILFNVVLMFFTCKNNFISIFNIIRKRNKKNKKKKGQLINGSDERNDEEDDDTSSNREEKIVQANKEYKIFTVILYGIFVISSLFLDQLQYLFSFLGAVCSTTMVILLPCLFYVMLIIKQREMKKPIYYWSIAIILIIIPFSVFSFISTFIVNFK